MVATRHDKRYNGWVANMIFDAVALAYWTYENTIRGPIITDPICSDYC
jgi:hypothetical protein